ncbi:MAG: hypothetical protein E7602_03345 [Ruminococcaceae bacterium]|nr:hypothetical protein [Oscillospiraceae bacterium]
MENNNQGNGGFTYTYSAKEQLEIKRIREKYTPSTEPEDKMARLRRLDASSTQAAQIVSLALGIVGTLILGFGMSLIMTELSKILGDFQNMAMTIGIVIGILGGAIASLAYPIYTIILKKKRKKIAPEIIRLTDELMK